MVHICVANRRSMNVFRGEIKNTRTFRGPPSRASVTWPNKKGEMHPTPGPLVDRHWPDGLAWLREGILSTERTTRAVIVARNKDCNWSRTHAPCSGGNENNVDCDKYSRGAVSGTAPVTRGRGVMAVAGVLGFTASQITRRPLQDYL